MTTRLLAAAGLSAALLLGGCQNPDGSTNWGNTLLLGAGVGTAAALVAGAASDNPRPRHYSYGHGGYRGGYYPSRGGYYGYGRGPYRGW
jgi:hypothetical protein